MQITAADKMTEKYNFIKDYLQHKKVIYNCIHSSVYSNPILKEELHVLQDQNFCVMELLEVRWWSHIASRRYHKCSPPESAECPGCTCAETHIGTVKKFRTNI